MASQLSGRMDCSGRPTPDRGRGDGLQGSCGTWRTLRPGGLVSCSEEGTGCLAQRRPREAVEARSRRVSSTN